MQQPTSTLLSQLQIKCQEAFAGYQPKIDEICGNESKGGVDANPDQKVPTGNEYADTWGFSWLAPLEQFGQTQSSTGRNGTEEQQQRYNVMLSQDKNFHNPAGVDLMSEMYGIQPYASIKFRRDSLGGWDFTSIRTQQVRTRTVCGLGRIRALFIYRTQHGRMSKYKRALG